MKVLVTGGLGFIGSNFILKILKDTDFEVINLDNEFYGSNHTSLSSIKDSENYQFFKGDITNQNTVNKLVRDSDVVVNFAAESHVDRSISNVKPFVNSNYFGVFTILEAIKKEKKRLVQISTDEVFGSLEFESADEMFRMNPSSPYASTKASAELLINSYFVTYDCDCVISRCTNNYGPRQFAEKLIPKTIILANSNKNIPVYGSGKNVRDWIYVEDHCDAILKILKDGKSGESYNISAKNEIDNITIIKKILSILEKSEDLMKFGEDRPGHDFRYSMNSSKIRNELNWSPKISFDKGLETTVRWYLENTKWWENIPDIALSSTPWKN